MLIYILIKFILVIIFINTTSIYIYIFIFHNEQHITENLNFKKTKKTPIWLMRQAGRYMKITMKLKINLSFMDMCKNEATTEITFQPIKNLTSMQLLYFLIYSWF